MNRPLELERFRLSKKEKNSLIALKRRTGIEHWNILCRWAFCLSLSEKKSPKDVPVVSDSNLDMGWKTFGGEHDQLLFHLLVERCLRDGLPTDGYTLVRQFRLHLQRGINYLAVRGKIGNINDLLELSLSSNKKGN